MGKTMAVIDDGIVTNMIWGYDTQPESDTLKDPGDRPVGIGDTYQDGKFYREGVVILTPLEEAEMRNAEYEVALREIEEALGVGL